MAPESISWFLLKRLKLMPYNPYLQAEMVPVGSGVQMPPSVAQQPEASGSRGKGKRKSTGNPAGESPSKKIAMHYDEDVANDV